MSDSTFDRRLAAEWDKTIRERLVPDPAELAARSGTERASRTAVIAELEELQLTLEDLRATLDETGARRLATRQWTVHDVLAHLASWARETRVETERLLTRQAFDSVIHFEPVGGPRAWNQREVAARREWPLADLFVEIEREHERLIALIVQMPDETAQQVVELPRTSGDPPQPWRMPLAAMILMSSRHERLHLARIDEILKK